MKTIFFLVSIILCIGCQTPKPSPVPAPATNAPAAMSIASMDQTERALSVGSELQMRDKVRTASVAAQPDIRSQGDAVATKLESMFAAAETDTAAVRSACGSLAGLFSNEIALYDFAARGRSDPEKLGLLAAFSNGIRAGIK